MIIIENTIIKENKTVSSEEHMLLEFGFNINGKRGRYLLETNNNQIIHEKLEFTLTKKGAFILIFLKINPLSTKKYF